MSKTRTISAREGLCCLTSDMRYWAPENPHYIVEKSLNASGLMVFIGITTYGPIGPFFFDELESNIVPGKKIKTQSADKAIGNCLSKK